MQHNVHTPEYAAQTYIHMYNLSLSHTYTSHTRTHAHTLSLTHTHAHSHTFDIPAFTSLVTVTDSGRCPPDLRLRLRGLG